LRCHITEVRTNHETEQHGVIDEVLPKSMYAVRLRDGRTVRASVDAKARHGIVRLLTGDGVVVTLTQHDPHRARITKKL
jgi:translation initiation factor IF-1